MAPTHARAEIIGNSLMSMILYGGILLAVAGLLHLLSTRHAAQDER